MEWKEVKQFLMSWGVYPTGKNPETPDGEMIMSTQCYTKMVTEAKTYGSYKLSAFITAVIDSTDGSFYAEAESWSEFQACWNSLL